jgi:hypothetical protein
MNAITRCRGIHIESNNREKLDFSALGEKITVELVKNPKKTGKCPFLISGGL